MKKSVKLISLLVVLALLVAGYVIYGKISADKPDETDKAEDTTVEILTLDPDSIVGIEYMLEFESVTMQKNEKAWKWTGDEEYPLSQTYPVNMVSTLSSLRALREIADGFENEADYGLDSPALVIKFVTDTEQSYEFSIGDYNPIAEGYYAKISGKDKVYFVNALTVDPFGYGMLDMIDGEKLPKVNAESITKVEFSSSTGTNVVTIDSTGAEFYSEPYVFFTKDESGKVVAVDGKAGGELMSAIAELSFSNAIAYKPDEQMLDICALSEGKRLSLTVGYKKQVENADSDTSVNVTTDEEYTLYLGAVIDEEGNKAYYATLPELNIVYKLNGGSALFTAMSVDFTSKLVCPVTTEDAVSFKCEIGGTNSVYFYNSADVENNEKIIDVLDKIAALTYTDKVNGEKGEVVFKTTFDTGEKEYVLNVYSFDEENYVASFDVFDGLLIPHEKVDGIIKALKEINE